MFYCVEDDNRFSGYCKMASELREGQAGWVDAEGDAQESDSVFDVKWINEKGVSFARFVLFYLYIISAFLFFFFSIHCMFTLHSASPYTNLLPPPAHDDERRLHLHLQVQPFD